MNVKYNPFACPPVNLNDLDRFFDRPRKEWIKDIRLVVKLHELKTLIDVGWIFFPFTTAIKMHAINHSGKLPQDEVDADKKFAKEIGVTLGYNPKLAIKRKGKRNA